MLSNKLRNCPTCAQRIPTGCSLGLRDLAILDGTAPGNVTVSNIDGIYHDRIGAQPWGRLLVIETKRLSEQMRPGQQELLGAMVLISRPRMLGAADMNTPQ